MEFNGLPLHPLSVHAAVVLGPLAALVALAYLVPPWRDRLRWPLAAVAVVATASVLVAYFSGDSFREANEFFSDPALPVTEQIDEHESLAENLLIATLGFAVVALLATASHQRSGVVRALLSVLLLVAAVAVIVLVYLTGDAGARAVWGEGFAG